MKYIDHSMRGLRRAYTMWYVSYGLFRRLLRGVEAYECLERPCQNRNTKDPA